METLRLHKPIGITPIKYWLDYRKANYEPDMKAIESQRLPKGAICGKLDPMATGELLVLVSDWNSAEIGPMADRLSNCEKVYEFGLLLGISTESDDRLGHVKVCWSNQNDNVMTASTASYNMSTGSTVSNGTGDTASTVRQTKDQTLDTLDTVVDRVIRALTEYSVTMVEQEYHVFSAKRAHNSAGLSQPLWWWKVNKRLSEISIPKHECHIRELEILGVEDINLQNFIHENVQLLSKHRDNLLEFNVDTIIDDWNSRKNSAPSNSNEPDAKIVKVRCRVTGGTFIRQICNDLIKLTGVPMMCTYIDRKQIFSL